MKRMFLFATALVVFSAVAGVALLAKADPEPVPPSDNETDAPLFVSQSDGAQPDEWKKVAKEELVKLAAKFVDSADKQEVLQSLADMKMKVLEIESRNRGAAKEREAEKSMQGAEQLVREAEKSLRNVLKLYPNSEAAKRARGRLAELGLSP